jgi:ferredoxin-NADP reductase
MNTRALDTGTLETGTALPADLYGRDRTDRFIRNLTAFTDAYRTLMERSGRGKPAPPPRVPGEPSWRTLVVASRKQECADVVSLRLAAPGGEPLPRWQPGAHLRVQLPSGLVRHYSLCDDVADRAAYTIAVRRIEDGGGGSVEMHDDLREGTPLRILGPRNGFPFAADRVVIFIAGGIGITPLLPMSVQAAARNLDWRLVYCGRSEDTMPFAGRLAALDPARTELHTDDVGGVPDCADLIRRAPHGAAVYCCGPPAMIDGVRAAVDRAGAAISAFHFERFTAAPITDGRAFEIELRRTGEVLAVPPDRSVLDVLRGHEPATPYSCRQGFCGTCLQRVVRGTVEHRDRRLTDAERAHGDMLVCVSRAPEGERLVLDL